MVEEVRKLVRNSSYSGNYESYKRNGDDWHSIGKNYFGVRSVFNLIESSNFNFVIDYGVLNDVWRYIDGRFDNDRAKRKMVKVSDAIKDRDSILGLEDKL